MLSNQAMHDASRTTTLTWLEPGEPFPPISLAWGPLSPAPGLLAGSACIDAAQLRQAYEQGIFPWYSPGQPVLWWSPDPRMVLRPEDFRLHRSLRQSLKQWLRRPDTQLVFDRDFGQVISRCAHSPRQGQGGTWITPEIIQAYNDLHQQGLAHSAELWCGGQLLAGLYFVALGHAVYGESMFTSVRDGSKMALALLVSVARHHGVALIDCQQNTRHLASLGAREIPRSVFVQAQSDGQQRAAIDWANEQPCWNDLLTGAP